MKPHTLRTHILTGAFGVNLFYCDRDISPGFNAFFAAMPVRGYEYECSRVQWHRDVVPALRRWVKARTGETLMKVVSSSDGLEEKEVLTMLDNRIAGKNDRVWLVFTWEPHEKQGYRACFKEVEFHAQEA